ncbi:MAG: hypothetical protein ACI8Y7_000187 [Candidatus Woesearchaeota archaeon]|jgi:hypothetical protein
METVIDELILLRHGDFEPPNGSLTVYGQEQAKTMA